jgi:hypothetical protein
VPFVDGAAFERLQGAFDAPSRCACNGILARIDRLDINPDGSANRHAVVTGTTRHISRVSTGDERLGGCASSIDAGAAEELAFDHSHLLTSSYEASRQRWARLPSPNDDGVQS